MNEALVSRSQAPAYSESDLELFANGLDQDLFPNVDWMNLILKDGAPTYRATVDLTGGCTVAVSYTHLDVDKRQELQFKGTPLRFGYIPVSNIPR